MWALGAPPVSAAPPELPASGEPRVEMFLQAFLEMAFWPSKTVNQPIAERVQTVQKLQPVVRVRLAASGYEEFLQNLLREEAATAGIDIVFLDDSDKSEDVFIEIHHYTDARGVCNTFPDVGDQGQPRVHAHADPIGVIRRMASRQMDTSGFFGCFNRETLHALGLNYDHDHPSVLSDQYSHWLLTPIDHMSVHTLYDPRVKPGLHWLGAMAAAREAVVDQMIADGAPPETATMGRQWVSNLAQYMIAQAEAGQVDFQTQLGFAYTYGEAGEYLPTDLAEGYKWFRRAAEAGDVEAQAQVGDALVHGRGVDANYEEGMRWLRMAAEKGNAAAKRDLDANDMRLRITIEPPAHGSDRR